MSTTNALDDRFDDARRGLEWLEKLEALSSRSASDRAAYEVAEYVMKLRTAVTELAGDRTAVRTQRDRGKGHPRTSLYELQTWPGTRITGTPGSAQPC